MTPTVELHPPLHRVDDPDRRTTTVSLAVVEIVHEQAGFPENVGGSAVTIGVFDGVHNGHRELLATLCRVAAEIAQPSVVVTFDRHPRSIVAPDDAPRLLTDLNQRLELLAHAGVDQAWVVRFDEERSLESPVAFVTDLIVERLHAETVVVGENFHFGHRQHGDVTVLAELGAEYGFKTLVQPSLRAGLTLDTRPAVSSTLIREAVASNDLDAAAGLLGRQHEVRGVVEHGDGRGGPVLGFPTANVSVPGDIQLPGDGVFAGWYERPDGTVHPAALSLGRRPTFYDAHGMRLLEAYLLDFDGDLYDERAKIRFQAFLHAQRRHDTVEGLINQLHDDVAATRVRLAIG
jgi:riboflavin kinase/FMN adenylyltransferase